MANCNNLFTGFNENLKITTSKRVSLIKSKDNLRKVIRKHFESEHPTYIPQFYIQGSYKMKTTIRTKDDTCDLDDGVYFKSNPDNVTSTTLQRWVKEAVDGVTGATPAHRKKCITVDYAAGYNIDLPVLLFDKDKDAHPALAVKNDGWREDDPKEFIEEYNRRKDANGQLTRMVKYLKAWCDHKRDKMPSGLCMTVLAMEHFQTNERDDVALKYLLVAMEKALKSNFQCLMPTTPKDDLFADYDASREDKFMQNLAAFIVDAKKAVDDEKNQLRASRLWQKHFGNLYFPDGEDKDERDLSAATFTNVIDSSRPYYGC